MTVEHKAVPTTPDAICAECPQNYKGACCAYNLPHSDEEYKARTTEYGMECDSPRLKRIRTERFGVKYHALS